MSNIFNNSDFFIEPAFAGEKAYTLVFAPDNNYAPYFAVALQSLICNSKPDELYDIVVFEENVSERNKMLLTAMIPDNFSLRFFNIDDFIKAKLNGFTLQSMRYWSVSMYYRLFIPFIMQKYERVMYADSDVCFNKPIQEFYEADFEGKELIAVLDLISPIVKQAEPKRYELYLALGIKKPENYFNSGILLFNLKQIDLPAYRESLKAALSASQLLYPDQDAANVIFYDKAKLVEAKWNCQYAFSFSREEHLALYSEKFSEYYAEVLKNPCIIHYTSSEKPWNAPKKQAAEIFWRYARMTPFYEEILFANLQGVFMKVLRRRKIFFDYCRYKILAHLVFGETKKKYKAEKSRRKALLKEISRIV